MPYTEIRCEVADGVCTITLHRPERLNAFTPTMMRELIEAFDQTDADDAVRAVIVTGAGRGFCAGADLGAGGRTFDYGEQRDPVAIRDGGGQVTLRIFESTKPVIAAEFVSRQRSAWGRARSVVRRTPPLCRRRLSSSLWIRRRTSPALRADR